MPNRKKSGMRALEAAKLLARQIERKERFARDRAMWARVWKGRPPVLREEAR